MAEPYRGESPDPGVPGLVGENSAAGDGVWGHSDTGRGVVGLSASGSGLWGQTTSGRGVVGAVPGGGSTDDTGVWGETESGRGVVGVSRGAGGAGVWGVSTGGRGVVGVVDRPPDDAGTSSVDEGTNLPDMVGDHGVIGGGLGATHLGDVVAGGSEVGGVGGTHLGDALSGADVIGGGLTVGNAIDVLDKDTPRGDDVGVWGETRYGRGVVGVVTEPGGAGVWGATTNGRSVVGVDAGVGNGVWGESATGRAVVGVAGGPGTAIYGEKRGDGGFAGFFVGDVHVSGSVSAGGDIVLVNADCAEDFDVESAQDVEPGTVMVLGANGALRPCDRAYDRRVAGVVSGAGTYRPALVLDRDVPREDRLPIALVGKVWCKVDATTEPVDVGDLLTSSARPGHARRATDRDRAFGAVIGKALGGLAGGVGLVPILIALQ
jgi:hypothetical protein